MSNLKILKSQIEHCLEKYPESRDCDVKLSNAVYITYYSHYLKKIDGEWLIPVLSRYKLPSEASIRRCRRKIQQGGKYLPLKEETRQKRKVRSQEIIEFISEQEINNIFN